MKQNLISTPPINKNLTKKEDTKAFLWLLLYSFILLFFLSPDSYLYDLYYHIDSACFFMCGKAWMCGMVPYVDFADSKGPLLWLIYGLGYLISHHSYIGVFWISILFYTATLFTAYKLCRLFADKDVSAVSVAALPFFLFCFICHFEIRAEDFCYPFVMLSIYCTCHILKYRDSDTRTYFKLSALMGICSMCCVLIKYNIGCMIMGLMAVVLYMAIRHNAGWQSFWGMVIGFMVPAVPFVICFLIQENLNAFIQEYFLNTFKTIENKNGTWLTRPHVVVKIGLMLVLLLSIYCFSRKHKLGYWLIPCFLLFIFGIGGYTYSYYYTIFSPFTIFFILLLFDFMMNKFPRLHERKNGLCALFIIFSIVINYYGCYQIRFKFNEKSNMNYYKAAYIMSQINNPKVMYFPMSYGIGTPAGSLPACKYWISQAGATKEMRKEADDVLRSGVADFVLIYNPNEKKIKEIENYGYVFYCNAPMYDVKKTSSLFVFGRPGLRLPPEDFHVSQWDVWLKRNIFGI